MTIKLTPKLKKLIPLLSIIVISIIYYFSYYKFFKIDVDEGLLLNGALRVLSGKLPLKDFHQYMPGRYYLLALWFLIFGKSVASARILILCLHTIKNVLTYIISRKIIPSSLHFFPVVMVMLLPGFWVKTFVGLTLLVNALLIINYIENRSDKNLALMGVSIGLSVYFREDMAGYSCLTALFILLFLGITFKESISKILINGLKFSGWIFLTLLPLGLLYILKGGIHRLIKGVWETLRLGHVESYPFRSPLVFLKWPINIKNRDLGLIFPYLGILLFIFLSLYLIYNFKTRKNTYFANFIVLAILMLAIFSFTHIWHWTHEFRMPQTGVLVHILWGYTLYLLSNRLKHAIQNKRIKNTSITIGAIFIVILIQILFVCYSFAGHPRVQYDAGGISLRRGYHLKIEGTDRSGILPPASQALIYTKILKYLKKTTVREDGIFCFGESPIYFLSERRNATEFDNGRIPAYFIDQRWKLIRQLILNKPKVIILRKWEYEFWKNKMPEVFKIITSHYYFDQKIKNFFIFLLMDNANHFAQKGNQYLWENDIPRATREYIKSIKFGNYNKLVDKILTRLFLNKKTSPLSLPQLEGYFLVRSKRIWRLRWGTSDDHYFSGKIIFSNQKSLKNIVESVVSSKAANQLSIELRNNEIIFASKIKNDWSGFDIIFKNKHPKLTIQFCLTTEEKSLERLFLRGKGIIDTNFPVILKKAPLSIK